MDIQEKIYQDKEGHVNSVYPPTKYLTNGPWIYLVPQFRPENVLMLGYSGGTVVGLIQLIYGKYVPITAVDIASCENFYGINLIQMDARNYIKTCPKFDVVIVDLFTSDVPEVEDFIFKEEFVSDLQKICNYLIVNITSEHDMDEYEKRFNKFGSNKPNRLSNRIYYYGNKDYNHLIIR